jgi:hypothetical protein
LVAASLELFVSGLKSHLAHYAALEWTC